MSVDAAVLFAGAEAAFFAFARPPRRAVVDRRVGFVMVFDFRARMALVQFGRLGWHLSVRTDRYPALFPELTHLVRLAK